MTQKLFGQPSASDPTTRGGTVDLKESSEPVPTTLRPEVHSNVVLVNDPLFQSNHAVARHSAVVYWSKSTTQQLKLIWHQNSKMRSANYHTVNSKRNQGASPLFVFFAAP